MDHSTTDAAKDPIVTTLSVKPMTGSRMPTSTTIANYIERIGDVFLFGLRACRALFRAPLEGAEILNQLAEAGTKSLPLVIPSGLALGAVMALHTRTTLAAFGSTSLIPALQAFAFFREIGPLVTGLLVAGRVGSGFGAVLADMRATEQIDALESLSIDSFKFLVVPRILACVLALPLLTLFMDFSGLLGGFGAEFAVSHIPFGLYMSRAFSVVGWSNFLAPTFKTVVFGYTIGTVSTYLGYTTDEGAFGVGRAATRSVVISSIAIILLDVILIKLIFFLFADSAL